MRRKVVFALLVAASACVTIPWAFRSSGLKSLELLVLHLFFFVDVLVRPPLGGEDQQDLRQVVWGKMLMFGLVYLPLYFTGASPDILWIEALGLGLTTFGAAFALWARLSLGNMATEILTITEQHSLYKEGPYHLIRHPIYSGFALAFVGHQLTFLSVPGFVVWALFLVFLRKRIQVEEEMLVKHFAGDYLEYQKCTWRMFPTIY